MPLSDGQSTRSVLCGFRRKPMSALSLQEHPTLLLIDRGLCMCRSKSQGGLEGSASPAGRGGATCGVPLLCGSTGNTRGCR